MKYNYKTLDDLNKDHKKALLKTFNKSNLQNDEMFLERVFAITNDLSILNTFNIKSVKDIHENILEYAKIAILNDDMAFHSITHLVIHSLPRYTLYRKHFLDTLSY